MLFCDETKTWLWLTKGVLRSKTWLYASAYGDVISFDVKGNRAAVLVESPNGKRRVELLDAGFKVVCNWPTSPEATNVQLSPLNDNAVVELGDGIELLDLSTGASICDAGKFAPIYLGDGALVLLCEEGTQVEFWRDDDSQPFRTLKRKDICPGDIVALCSASSAVFLLDGNGSVFRVSTDGAVSLTASLEAPPDEDLKHKLFVVEQAAMTVIAVSYSEKIVVNSSEVRTFALPSKPLGMHVVDGVLVVAAEQRGADPYSHVWAPFSAPRLGHFIRTQLAASTSVERAAPPSAFGPKAPNAPSSTAFSKGPAAASAFKSAFGTGAAAPTAPASDGAKQASPHAFPFNTAASRKDAVGVPVPNHQFGDVFALAKRLAAGRTAVSGFVADLRGEASVRRIVTLAELNTVASDTAIWARKDAMAFIAKVQADLTALESAVLTNDYAGRDALRGKLHAEARAIEAKLRDTEVQCRGYGQKVTRMQGFDYVPMLDEHGGSRELLAEAQTFAAATQEALTNVIDQYNSALELLTTNVVAVMMNSAEEIERRCVALNEAADKAKQVLQALGLFDRGFSLLEWGPLRTFVADLDRNQAETTTNIREAMTEVEAVVTAVVHIRSSLLSARQAEIDAVLLDSKAAHDVAIRLCSLCAEARDAAEEAAEASSRFARLQRKGTVTNADREATANALRQKEESAAALAVAFKRYYQPLMVHYSETRDILNEAFPAGDPASHRGDVSLSHDFIAVTDGPTRDFSGCVTLMTERATGVPVMLKKFRIDQQTQFRKECDALRRVKHPYVAELRYTFFEHSDQSHYMVLPYYAGGTLDEWVELVADDAEALLRAFMQVAQGLTVLHANGITHCDVKPANVVMTSKLASAMPRIIDFDVAKLVDSDFLTTVSWTMSGSTAGFAAPEFIEFMEKGFRGREVAQTAQLLRSPSVDAYAFGRTLAVLIDPGNDSNGSRTWTFPDTDTSRVANTLAPFATEVEVIVAELVAASPTERMTLAQAQTKLAALWAVAHKPRSDAAERDAKPVECCICYSEVAQRETIACTVAPERRQPSHVYCRECFNTNVTSWGALPPTEHVATNGALFCTHPTAVGVGSRCAGTFDNSVALSLLTPDHLTTVQRVFGQVRELETLAAVKRQAEAKQSDVERAVAHIDEVIRAFRCPHCETPSAIDFNHCMQLTCTLCLTTFCAYCLAITDTSHRHVATQHEDEDLGLFATEDVWRRHWHKVKHEEVVAFIKTLPTAIQAEVQLRTR